MSNASVAADRDPSTVSMPSLDSAVYVKEASFVELNAAKVINLSAYFFTFPLSLQRESIYAKYRYYDITQYGGLKHNVNEATVGLTFNTVVLNSFSFPVSLEYIYNDADFIQYEGKFRFLLGASF